MEIDDFGPVFHLGEELFRSQEVPNLYRTWDEYELIQLYHGDSDFCLVAEDETTEHVVGFALGTTVTKNHSAWKYGHLVWLGVASSYQDQGVGERLFRVFRDRMVKDGVRILLADTEADNHGAIKFFNKLGFSNPQEHIYLSLNLDAQKQSRKAPGRRDESPAPAKVVGD
jgi:ribosomal protein S18 acetylase RimI-like enzyme